MQRKALLSIKTLAISPPPKHSTSEAYSLPFFPARANFPYISFSSFPPVARVSSPNFLLQVLPSHIHRYAFVLPSLCLRFKSYVSPMWLLCKSYDPIVPERTWNGFIAKEKRRWSEGREKLLDIAFCDVWNTSAIFSRKFLYRGVHFYLFCWYNALIINRKQRVYLPLRSIIGLEGEVHSA